MSLISAFVPQISEYRIILASQSPRRKAILLEMGIEPEIVPSEFAEDLSRDQSAENYVKETAYQKALEVSKRVSGDNIVIIASDTVVVGYIDGKETIFEKPGGPTEQFQMLKQIHRSRLPGADTSQHLVMTAVVVLRIDNGQPMVTVSKVEKTIVQMDDWTDDQLMEYVNTSEGWQVAGGYKIQSIGGLLMKSVIGDYSSVVGLPKNTTLRLLERCFGK